MAMTSGQRVATGVAVVAGAGLLAYALWPKKASASESPVKLEGSFETKLADETPLVKAAVIDVIGDGSASALVPLVDGWGDDYSDVTATLSSLAAAEVGPKTEADGEVVALVSVGFVDDPPGTDLAEAARRADANLHTGYDRVIWIVSSDIAKERYDAIRANVKEYVALADHGATPNGLSMILWGAPFEDDLLPVG